MVCATDDIQGGDNIITDNIINEHIGIEYRLPSETELKVLREFATKGDLSGYDLHSRKPKVLSSGHWIKVKRFLLNNHLMQKKRTEGKRGKILYGITLQGLLALLAFEPESWKKIETIANKNKDKLLIFQKWSFFKQENLDQKLEDALRLSLYTFSMANLDLFTFASLQIKRTEEELRSIIDSMVLGAYSFRLEDKINPVSQEILEACKKEPELRQFIILKANAFKQSAQRILERIDRNLEHFSL